MNFRHDINGLRAIAVLAVVFFHFKPEWVPGGFAGVDVFFVISGFLMTRIIFKGFENDNFNLIRFISDRAHRIIPALTSLSLILLVFGWFYLTPLEYRELGKHTASSMSFISNMVYWRESGYFDVESHKKWMLHTWSLSVEWQFYIIYPLILVALKKTFSIKNLKRLILIGTSVSFGFCIISTLSWPIASYYLLHSRAWELMIGGVAYLYPWTVSDGKNKFVESVGLCLIIFSFTFFSSNDAWPGYFSLIPVLGTYLVIISNQQSSIITNNPPLQHIGKWSYSIYLWHWPVVVLGYYDVDNWYLYGIPISIALGFLSYRFLEKPKIIRFYWGVINPNSHLLIIIIATMSMGFFVFSSGGLDSNYRMGATSPKAYMEIYHRDNYITPNIINETREECNFFDINTHTSKLEGIDNNCFLSKNNKKILGLLWGDSHAQALSHGLRNQIPNMELLQVASSACRPSVSIDYISKGEFKKSCDLSNKKAFETILDTKPDFVFLAQRYDHDLNDYIEITNMAKENGINSKFILVGPVPQWKPSLPQAISIRHMNNNKVRFNDPYFVDDLFRIERKLKEKYSKSDDLIYISLLDELCNQSGCIAKVDNNNTPIVWDYGHLSLQGSNYVVKNIIKPRLNSHFPLTFNQE
ncbi:acyltransferase family protein [Vibrio coralliilyticus]|uniref:acyltransferase family protein n=1 Tax=Vibrio coralliilyticus TaxID=190893 RepID=UPI002FD6E92E